MNAFNLDKTVDLFGRELTTQEGHNSSGVAHLSLLHCHSKI